jgi:hypothetical protein
MSQIVRRVSER